MAMTRPQQIGAGFLARNPYAMDMDRSWNRNCYTCRGFGHIARNCRNRENRRIEVDQVNSNLNGEGDLGSPN